MKLILDQSEMLGRWMVKRIPHFEGIDDLGKFVAVGVATGQGRPEDKLLAVVAYHEWYPRYAHCQLSVAAADPRWVFAARAILEIPFIQWQCNKVWIASPHTDERAIKLAKKLGFTQESGLKDHFGRGVSAVISRMLIGDYQRKYIHGQVQSKQHAAAA